MKSVWAHTLVKNEEHCLWYSIGSVIDFVDKVLLWDTGSTDDTLRIAQAIKKRYPSKIELREVGEVDKKGFPALRQKMLDESESDWVFVIDGDEIWWEGSIKKVIGAINRGNIDAVISPYVNLIGDPYHYQEEKAGRYQIDQKVGNITIRAFNRKISGLHVENPYGLEGYFDRTGKAIQESPSVKRVFVNTPFLHLTHLKRSRKDGGVMGRAGKVKHELGIPLPFDFYYPEVLFRPGLPLAPSFWEKVSLPFTARAIAEYPFRKIKRLLHG